MDALRRLFVTSGGRVRLAWRLLGFLLAGTVTLTVVGVALPAGLVSGSLALLAGALAGGWLLLGLEGHGPAALGFPLSREAPGELAKGVGLGVLIGMVVVALMAGTGGLRWSPDDGNALSWVVGAGGALLFFAIPAAAEEALLRGYPLQALAEAWGTPRAVAVTAAAFGLLHVGNPGAGWLETLNVGLAGLLLGVVYVRTLSLWWATGVHLGWNWSHGYAADVAVSGLDVVDAPLYQGVASGPGWLSGGPFGPEGTLAATVVLTGAAAACWWGPWLRPGVAARAAGALVRGQLDREV